MHSVGKPAPESTNARPNCDPQNARQTSRFDLRGLGRLCRARCGAQFGLQGRRLLPGAVFRGSGVGVGDFLVDLNEVIMVDHVSNDCGEDGQTHGGVRPFHQKSTCLTQLTSGPHVVT